MIAQPSYINNTWSLLLAILLISVLVVPVNGQDNDQVRGNRDWCPNKDGPKGNNGCPVSKQVEANTDNQGQLQLDQQQMAEVFPGLTLGFNVDTLTDCSTKESLGNSQVRISFLSSSPSENIQGINGIEGAIIRADGYKPLEIENFKTVELSLGFVSLKALVPNRDVCLEPTDGTRKADGGIDVAISYFVDQLRTLREGAKQESEKETVTSAISDMNDANSFFSQGEIQQGLNNMERAGRRVESIAPVLSENIKGVVSIGNYALQVGGVAEFNSLSFSWGGLARYGAEVWKYVSKYGSKGWTFTKRYGSKGWKVLKKYGLHLKLITLIVKYGDDISYCYSYCGQLSEEAQDEYTGYWDCVHQCFDRRLGEDYDWEAIKDTIGIGLAEDLFGIDIPEPW